MDGAARSAALSPNWRPIICSEGADKAMIPRKTSSPCAPTATGQFTPDPNIAPSSDARLAQSHLATARTSANFISRDELHWTSVWVSAAVGLTVQTALDHQLRSTNAHSGQRTDRQLLFRLPIATLLWNHALQSFSAPFAYGPSLMEPKAGRSG
jgi:hypothetical protein